MGLFTIKDFFFFFFFEKQTHTQGRGKEILTHYKRIKCDFAKKKKKETKV